MLCDELKDYDYDPDFPFQSRGRFYVADEVEVAIDELKQKLEDAKATAYTESVDANMEIRRLQRALYNLRARYADMMQNRYIESKTDGWVHRVNKWIEVERRCLNKAEEYR